MKTLEAEQKIWLEKERELQDRIASLQEALAEATCETLPVVGEPATASLATAQLTAQNNRSPNFPHVTVLSFTCVLNSISLKLPIF